MQRAQKIFKRNISVKSQFLSPSAPNVPALSQDTGVPVSGASWPEITCPHGSMHSVPLSYEKQPRPTPCSAPCFFHLQKSLTLGDCSLSVTYRRASALTDAQVSAARMYRDSRLSSNPSLVQSVQFGCSVVSDSLRPHGLQQARPPCPSPTPGACSDSQPSHR